MGSMRAIDFNEQVKAGNIRLEIALMDHLEANHYPPLPVALVPTAMHAIDLANIGDWDEVIDMPPRIQFRDRDTASVSEIVKSMHLDAFLEVDEDEIS
jgi:hypothetical protein